MHVQARLSNDKLRVHEITGGVNSILLGAGALERLAGVIGGVGGYVLIQSGKQIRLFENAQFVHMCHDSFICAMTLSYVP